MNWIKNKFVLNSLLAALALVYFLLHKSPSETQGSTEDIYFENDLKTPDQTGLTGLIDARAVLKRATPRPDPDHELNPNAALSDSSAFEKIQRCTDGDQGLKATVSAGAQTANSSENKSETASEALKRIADYLLKAPLGESLVHVHNVHVELPSGEKRRLQILPGEPTNRSELGWQLRYFSVDREDLPVPESLPTELKDLAPEAAVDIFKSSGRVTLEEKELSLRLEDGRSARIRTQGERITEIELYLKGGVLQCSRAESENRFTGVSCRCELR